MNDLLSINPRHTQGGNLPRPRVLHVIDLPGAGYDALAAARCCAAEINADQRLLLIGDADAARDAAALGLNAEYRLCPPLNRLPAAVGPLDALLSDIRRAWPIDAIHTWSDSARILCRQTVGYQLPLTQDDPAFFCADAALSGDRDSIRAQLGVAQNETAVLLAADRPGVGDARRFAGLIGVLHLADVPLVGLASTRCDNFRRAARFLRGFSRAWDVIPLATPPHATFAAADIVVYDQGETLSDQSGPGPRTGGIVLAAASLGLPVVTTDTPLARRLLGPTSDTLLAAGPLMPEIARPLVPLCNDPALRAQVGNRLRQHTRTLIADPVELLQRWHAAARQGAAA